jgi:flagellar assembly factor FliW
VHSTRFGDLDIAGHVVLTFPSGILGFPDWTRYVILEHHTEAPFRWLQCLDEPDLAFVIMDPALFKPDYQLSAPPDTLSEIQCSAPEDLGVVVILTIPSEDPSTITANLRGPLLISHRTRLGKQLVLTDDFPTRYPLFPAVRPVPAEPHLSHSETVTSL